jgi:hypothetical protein
MKLTLYIDIWIWDIIPFYTKNKLAKSKRTIHTIGWACLKLNFKF